MRSLLPLVAAAAATAQPPVANADVFGPIGLASAVASGQALYEQANEAIEPVISGDGRYVAFVGRFAGVKGIWRRDLETGVVEQVAGGEATLPSISADGRYVSFTTNERLVPADDFNRGPDVYRRDMTLPCTPAESGESPCGACPEEQPAQTEGCPYAVVSAIDGSEGAPEYLYPSPAAGSFTAEQEERGFGSLAAGRSAMSSDGRYIAFVTTTGSASLAGGEATPALQVLVRDTQTDTTELVSREYEVAGPVQLQEEAGHPIGAVYPGGAETPRFVGEATAHWLGASISADGSTVAWMGQDIGRQARMLPGEQNTTPIMTEPLWRRIADGAGASTRRVTGGSDPDSPACQASGEQRLVGGKFASPSDPCAGPLGLEPNLGVNTSPFNDFVPQLSADGRTVAFLSGARQLASGEVDNEEQREDLYVSDMAEGLTRVRALRRLTQKDGTGAVETEKIAKAGTVTDLAVSPDGSQVAFTTQRTLFPLLGSLSYVSAPAARPGMSELFDIDLATETMTRVTHGFGGADEPSEELHVEQPGSDPYTVNQGAFSPSFSADGEQLGFSSTADNLVFGDVNGETDAFVVHRVTFPVQHVNQYVSPVPESPAITPARRLAVTTSVRVNGSVLVNVVVPGPGSLQAVAKSAIRVVLHRTKARRASVVARTVASAHTAVHTSSEGLQILVLKLGKPYLALAARRHGLEASVRVTFTSARYGRLTATVPITFRRSVKSHPGTARKRRHR